MISYKCKNCGGQMNFGGAGGFVCPYCGSKSFLSDADFKGNEVFRKKLLEYYKAEADKKENDYDGDRIWFPAGTDVFSLPSGQRLEIRFMKKDQRDGYVCYIARETVVYVFDEEKDAGDFLCGLKKIVFPEADDRLHRSFPELQTQLSLTEGKNALVFRRRPNFYPAAVFSPWESVHLCWVISRMENVCCTLDYSGIEHLDISPDSFFVNPITHEGALFGDWRKVRALSGNEDLKALRRTAIALAENTAEPKGLYRFLNSAPQKDAFSDFSEWDRVIETEFGGHRFVKMNV